MGYTTRIAYEPLRSIDSATFNGTYMTIGTYLPNQSYILKFVNNSNTLITVSTDGVTDMDVCPANSFYLYDEDTSGNPTPEGFPAHTQFYVKGSAGVGLVYLVSIYIVGS